MYKSDEIFVCNSERIDQLLLISEKIKKIVFTKGVSISSTDFYRCSNLETIEFLSLDNYFGLFGSFRNCNKIKHIIFNTHESKFNIDLKENEELIRISSDLFYSEINNNIINLISYKNEKEISTNEFIELNNLLKEFSSEELNEFIKFNDNQEEISNEYNDITNKEEKTKRLSIFNKKR